MSKKRVTFIAVVLLLVAVGSALMIYSFTIKEPTTVEDAILQAQNYKPKGGCVTWETPAIHRKTGATYTFPTGCIPDGWMVPNPLNQP